jgi:hypothetical protein
MNIIKCQQRHGDHITTGDTHNRGGMWHSHPELIFENKNVFKDRGKNDVKLYAHTQNY